MTYTATAGVRAGSTRRATQRRLRQWTTIIGLALSDIIAFNLAYRLFLADNPLPLTVRQGGNFLLPPTFAVDWFFIIAGFFVFIRYLFGDYGRRQLFWDGARLTTIALMVAALPHFLMVALGAPAAIGGFFAAWVFLLFAVPMLRQGMRRLMAYAGLWNTPTALIGSGRNAGEAYSALRNSLSLGFDVRHIVIDGASVPEGMDDLIPIHLSNSSDIVKRLTDAGCRQVVIASDDAQNLQIADAVQRLIAADIGVAIVPSLRGLPLFGLSTNYFFGKEILLLQVRNNLARLPYRILKRFLDIVGSVIIMVLLSPLLLAIAIAIMLNDNGSPIFTQRRVGYRGRDFACLKFRTMAHDAEERLSRWEEENPDLLQEYRRSNFKLRNDPRVTRIGWWLRRTSLDELPQLVNVLVGHMSLVGPRPLLAREIPDYGSLDLYCLSRPGITGLWQISGRSQTTFQDRVAFDGWYIRNWSLWYDIVILFQTFSVLVRRDGAY
jgi:undecaprenyl-phosphate galactose phosphotransferase